MNEPREEASGNAPPAWKQHLQPLAAELNRMLALRQELATLGIAHDRQLLRHGAIVGGIGGNPLFLGRPEDSFGLGVFYYEYDELQRLSYEGQFVDGEREYENYYEYDPAGNRTLLRHGQLLNILKDTIPEFTNNPELKIGALRSVSVLEYAPSGRVQKIRISTDKGDFTFEKDTVRWVLGNLKSTLFVLEVSGRGVLHLS